jgi:putative salt-induced outer membrane protein YdiY
MLFPALRRPARTTAWQILLAALILLLGQVQFAEAQDTFRDRIYLKNGDRISGTIKELDRGKLRIKTTTMDTIYVNWVDVASIQSSTYLRIAKTDGSFQYGRVTQSSDSENLMINDAGTTVAIPSLEVASMKPIRVGESLWHRVEGDISAGIDYKKASDILLVNLASNIRLREEKHEISVSLNWNETQRNVSGDSTGDEDKSSRASLNGEFTRFLGDRWFWKASAGFERNQELGIDLRSIFGASAGKYFIQTSTMRFEVNAGFAASAESRTDATKTESIEGLIRSSFDIFQLNIPITRLTANIDMFPGITEKDRFRLNTSITLRNELVRDFFWDLSFYSSFDNQPADGAEEEDYGIVTSLGASF